MSDDGWRDKAQANYDRLYASYDRTILGISGGALALSITFVSEIAGPDPDHLGRLGWGWALLVLSVLFVALSYLPSVRAHYLALADKDSSKWGKWGDRMSVAAGILMAGGLGLLAWFAFNNLKGITT